MEKLKLTPNRPEVIALAFTAGKPVSSNFTGEQMMYTLSDGRLWFADLEAAAKVDALNLGRGEPCEVTMCVDRAKQKSYEVRYLAADQPAADVEVPRTPAYGPRLTGKERAPQPPVRQRVEAQANGTTGQVVQVPVQHTSPSPNTTGGKLMACLLVAVDSLLEVEAYANRKGLAIKFSAEDVRTVGNTIFINESKGGR
jgi:hypothetical protein